MTYLPDQLPASRWTVQLRCNFNLSRHLALACRTGRRSLPPLATSGSLPLAAPGARSLLLIAARYWRSSALLLQEVLMLRRSSSQSKLQVSLVPALQAALAGVAKKTVAIQHGGKRYPILIISFLCPYENSSTHFRPTSREQDTRWMR